MSRVLENVDKRKIRGYSLRSLYVIMKNIFAVLKLFSSNDNYSFFFLLFWTSSLAVNYTMLQLTSTGEVI